MTNSEVKLSQITKIYSGICSEDNKKMIIESVRNQKPYRTQTLLTSWTTQATLCKLNETPLPETHANDDAYRLLFDIYRYHTFTKLNQN